MKAPPWSRGRTSACQGFTLVELLVAIAILGIIMVLVSQMIGATSSLWKRTSAKIDSLRDARLGFELMTDQLRQATTNTYWDYFNAAGQTTAQWTASGAATPFLPAAYGRQSELHFISGSSNLGLVLPNGTQVTQGVFFQFPGGYTGNSAYSTLNTL